MEFLIHLDRQLFIFINHLPHNDTLNSFFAFLSGIGSWGIIWILIAMYFFVWEEIKDRKRLFALIFAISVDIILVEIFLKNYIHRLRPFYTIPEIFDIYGSPSSFSFPSGHTTIAFAAAYILGKNNRRLSFFYYFLAFLIAFSRVYLGKHYPVDVVAGTALGLIIGFLSTRLADYLWSRGGKKINRNRQKGKR
jgi:undecaprenyl-diphosphatase